MDKFQKSVLGLNASLSIFDTLMVTFINVFLLLTVANPILGIGLYQISWVILVNFGILYLIRFSKHGRLSPFILRIGVGTAIATLGAIAISPDILSRFVWVIGILYGAATAMMYSQYNVLIANRIPATSFTKFENYNSGIKQFMTILAGAGLGTVITMFGFSYAAIIVMAILCAGFIATFGIPAIPKPGRPEKLQLREFMNILRRKPRANLIMLFALLRGMTAAGVLVSIGVIYATELFGTAKKVGFVMASVTAVIILLSFVIGKFKRHDMMIRTMNIGAIIFAAAVLLFVLTKTQTSYVIYACAYAFFGAFCGTIDWIYTSKWLKLNDINEKWNSEYLAIREMVLNIGRITGFGALALIGLFGLGAFAIQGMLITGGTIMVVIAYVINVMYLRYKKSF